MTARGITCQVAFFGVHTDCCCCRLITHRLIHGFCCAPTLDSTWTQSNSWRAPWTVVFDWALRYPLLLNPFSFKLLPCLRSHEDVYHLCVLKSVIEFHNWNWCRTNASWTKLVEIRQVQQVRIGVVAIDCAVDSTRHQGIDVSSLLAVSWARFRESKHVSLFFINKLIFLELCAHPSFLKSPF